jgi:hypothetical protein
LDPNHQLGEFLKFVQKHQASLFMSDYVLATDDYLQDIGEGQEPEQAIGTNEEGGSAVAAN